MAPELLLALVMTAGVILYALLGGADFGAGVWELTTALQPERKERALLYRAIGPVWEANHVWLIFVIVVLWTAFPPAFAALCRAAWVPLLLALVGIVFRGSAYAFRSYAVGERQRRAWEGVFALASTIAPFFLGATAGAVATGELAVTADGGYAGDVLTGWISPFSLFCGGFAVATSAHLAAVYLAREAALEGDPELTALCRRRALEAALGMGALALGGLLVMRHGAPHLWAGLAARGWPLVLLSIVGGATSLLALRRERYGWATLGAGLAVASVIGGWAAAQFPMVIAPALSITRAKAPDSVLWPLLIAIGLGTLILLPALGYLFWLFKSGVPAPLERDYLRQA